MKSIYCTLLLLSTSICSFAQNVSIPDSAFRAYLLSESTINTNGDTLIQNTEALAYTGKITFSAIPSTTDLTGLGAFENITELELFYGSFTQVDLSKNTLLTKLTIKLTMLPSIDLSANTILEDVYCEKNDSLTSLDVSNCNVLRRLYCRYNDLSTITLPQSSTLTSILCKDNQLTTIDLSSAPNLITFDGDLNQFNTIDFSNNTELSIVKISSNPIQSIDLSKNSKLSSFNCSSCGLSNIDFTSNLELSSLTLSRNDLATIDLSKNALLRSFTGIFNDFETLDLSGAQALVSINLAECEMKHIDVSMLPNLQSFNIAANPVTTVNIANGENDKINTFRAVSCPSLTCIQVDDTTYSQSNWKLIDSTISKYKLKCETSSVGINDIKTSFDFFPNPTYNHLNSDEFIGQEISIYNLMGDEVINIISSTNKLDVSDLASGTYTLRIFSKSGIGYAKFLKQ